MKLILFFLSMIAPAIAQQYDSRIVGDYALRNRPLLSSAIARSSTVQQPLVQKISEQRAAKSASPVITTPDESMRRYHSMDLGSSTSSVNL